MQVPLTRHLKIQYLESGIQDVKSIRSSIFTTDYMFIFRNETCWSRVGQEFQQGQVEETDVPETISS